MEQTKPHKGRIKDWCFVAVKHGRTLIVVGDALDHEYMRKGITTSEVVKYDKEISEIETLNSRYTLVDEGESPRLKGWPNSGDKMRFLGKDGYEYELKEAKCIFSIGALYTVENVDIGDWSHTIKFKNIEGRWNGVMFEYVGE